MAKTVSAVVGRLKGETKTTIQTVIFSPKKEWTLAEAKSWLKEHDFKAPAVDETGSSYRFRQRNPGDFQEDSFRTISLKGAKKAELADLNESEMEKAKKKQRIGSAGHVPPMEGDLISQGEPTQPYFMEDKKVDKHYGEGTRLTGFVPGGGSGKKSCGMCTYYCSESGCYEPKVLLDDEVPDAREDGYKAVEADDYCQQYKSQADALDAAKTRTPGDLQFKKFVRITKVDEAKREVGGAVTAEVKDNVGETCHYKTTKPFYEQWSETLAKATNGKNLGNLREMHGLSAAGAGKSIDFDDEEKLIYMTFKVVDDSAWKKCAEGVYTGFSQGGDYIKKWDGPNGEKFYTARPTEVSLVDLPCLPEATFDFIRADGTHELRKFAQGGGNVKGDQSGQQPDLTKRLEAIERSLQPIIDGAAKKIRANNVLTNFRKTEANKERIAAAVASTIEKVGNRMGLQKDLYTVKSFAQVLQDLAYIRMSCEYEAQREGDDSTLPAALQQDLESLAESFLTMAQEEVGELVQSADSIGKVQGGTMIKLAPADLEKAAKNIAKHFAGMRKSLETFNKGMSESIGQAHKILGVEEATDMGDGKPQAAGAQPAGATKPNYSFKVLSEHKLENGDVLKVYVAEEDSSIQKTELIKAGTAMLNEGEVQKRIDEGIDRGVQEIVKALYGDPDEVERVVKAAKAGKKPADGSASGSASGSPSGSASGSPSGSASGSASGDDDKKPTKKADGVGDRTQTPTVLANAGPVVRVMPVTKTDDNRMVETELQKRQPAISQEDVLKAMTGDTAAALKLMRGAQPTDIPPTLVEAVGKVAGSRV